MRYIKDLNREFISLLRRIYKSSDHHQVRQRAHCILLSYQGYSISELASIFNVQPRTIRNWFDDWETERFVGLYDDKGRGRKPKLNPEQQIQVVEWTEASSRNLAPVIATVHEEFDIQVSKYTVKRILKNIRFSWRRIRRSCKGQPDPEEYQQKKTELEALKILEENDLIELFYYDESGFCLVPYIPYAWQKIGQTIEIESSKSNKRINILGFLSRTKKLIAYTTENTVNGEFLVAILDDLCQQITKRTVVVMDQAPFHTSQAIQEKLSEWESKGLEIFLLPTYSPHLNLIEILWKMIKYEWLDFKAYKNWESLVSELENIIKNYGTEYEINFS